MARLEERDADNLLRILDYCDRIDEIVSRFGDGLDVFLKDADYQDAIKMNIFQIGETVNNLSEDCKEVGGDIPWHQIYGMRNIIAHGYEKVNDERIWDTVKSDIPVLKTKIEGLLKSEGVDVN